MSPETAAYFNDLARRLRDDPDALNKDMREQMARVCGFEPHPVTDGLEPDDE